jgi:2-polyprenyl-3-methyl-5-hydroxy-6-metoxy-1,4-benzoquinol methylase
MNALLPCKQMAAVGRARVRMDCPICEGTSRLDAPHPEVQLFRCTHCEHRFSRTKPGVSAEPYDPEYFQKTHRNWFAHPDLSLFEQIARRAEREPEPHSLIDVGCGNGNLLRYLAGRLGPKTALAGIDLSANKSTENIEFIQGDVLSAPLDQQFSIVVSLATIEHISDVRSFTRRLQSLVKPNGLVIVMTINDDSLLYWTARLLNRVGVRIAFDRLYSRHHLHHFSRSSLSRLLASEGLKPEAVILHNAPLAAIDVPASSPPGVAVLRLGLAVLNGLGRLSRKSYLQTVICRREQA